LFIQFDHHFCKIAFNRVLLANSVKIVNGTVTRWNCLGYVSNFWIYDGTRWHSVFVVKKLEKKVWIT